ncbi:GxxExxY protein [bacterium]|nr:GxxExxY protein [bacterium]
MLETKAVKELCDNHRAQIINYLKATKMKLGLLVNFGETSLKYERFINNY